MIPSTLLDSNAGAPIHPFVMAALSDFLKTEAVLLGNPSSLHEYGRRASSLVAKAKESVLRALGASPDEWNVVFTSGGTEANQLAIRGVLETALERGERPLWLVSPLEHHCVLDLVEPMKGAGVEVRLLKVDAQGQPQIFAELAQKAALISVMNANNETGLIVDFATLTSHIQCGETPTHHPLLHCDAVAGWGKARLDLSDPGAPDLIAIAGHKLGALSGIGALIFRRSIALRPLLRGTQQEGLRGGTENLIGIRSLLAISERWSEIREEIEGLRKMRDRFEEDLKRRFPQVRITGESLPRVPHLSHFHFEGFARPISLVAQLDMKGFAVSAGSACASAIPEPSHVLLAMGLSKVNALNSLRVSLHPGSAPEDLSGLLAALEAILKRYESA